MFIVKKFIKIVVLIVLFLVPAHVFCMQPSSHEDTLFNQLIETLKQNDLKGLHEVLAHKKDLLMQEAQGMSTEDAVMYISAGLKNFVCKQENKKSLFPLLYAKSVAALQKLVAAGASLHQEQMGEGGQMLNVLDLFLCGSEVTDKEDLLPYLIHHGLNIDFGTLIGLIMGKQADDLFLLLERKIISEYDFFIATTFADQSLREDRCLPTILMSIMFRYPEMVLSHHDRLRGLPFGEHFEYTIDDEEIRIVEEAREKNRARWLEFEQRQQIAKAGGVVQYLHNRELGK